MSKIDPSPNEAILIALASIARKLERIANALEKRPTPNRTIRTPHTGPWIAWHGHHVRPWENLDPKLTVRVQFQSKPDHVETYYLDSSEIDWTDVIAYQIVNRSE